MPSAMGSEKDADFDEVGSGLFHGHDIFIRLVQRRVASCQESDKSFAVLKGVANLTHVSPSLYILQWRRRLYHRGRTSRR